MHINAHLKTSICAEFKLYLMIHRQVIDYYFDIHFEKYENQKCSHALASKDCTKHRIFSQSIYKINILLQQFYL